jgi:hypothetical protein
MYEVWTENGGKRLLKTTGREVAVDAARKQAPARVWLQAKWGQPHTVEECQLHTYFDENHELQMRGPLAPRKLSLSEQDFRRKIDKLRFAKALEPPPVPLKFALEHVSGVRCGKAVWRGFLYEFEPVRIWMVKSGGKWVIRHD